MTRETHPDPVADPSNGSWHPSLEPEIGSADLPPGLGEWAAALSLCPSLDEQYYVATARVFAADPVPGWDSFTRAGVQGQLLEAGASTGTYVFRREWRAWLRAGVEALGGERAVLTAMVEAGVAASSTDLISQTSMWARELERWDLLARVWATHGQNGGLPAATLEIFRDLPTAARESQPILTWASGTAISLLSKTPEARLGAVWERLLLDSAMLHANWKSRTETDGAVQAGTFRMIGEQALSSTQPGQSLDAAWRTKLEIDAFIDARSQVGDSPGRTDHAVFRAFSARLALFRSDPLIAINEARLATMLSDWEPAATMAAEIEALALSASAASTKVHQSEPSMKALEERLEGWGHPGMDQT